MKKIFVNPFSVIKAVYTKIRRYLTSAYRLFDNNNIEMLPAYIAFFTLWSIVPIIIIWDTVEKLFPTIVNENAIDTELINSTFEFINIDTSFGDGSYVLLVVILYLSSKPFMSMISASNYIYDLKEHSNFFKMKFKSVVLSLILLVTILLLLLIPVLGERIILLIENVFGQYDFIDKITSVRWLLTVGYVVVVVFLIYAGSPSKRINFRFFLPGTLFTTFGWVVVTYVYAYYVNDFANYTKIYSSFTNVIILMIWLYLISYILVIGLVINAAYFKEKKKWID